MSLVPSATETLAAWGITPVAVTRFCERPDLVVVGGTKDPDLAAVIAAEPDLVVMCEEENRRQDYDALLGAGLDIYVFSINELAEVTPQLAGLAAAVGADPSLVPALAPMPRPGSLRAFVPIWRRPWMSLADGTYGASLLGALGVRNVFGDSEQRYPEVSLEQAVEAGAEVVFAPSEPYPFGERHRAELQTVAPVVFVDGADLFWWGVRTPGALERLAAAVPSA